MATLNKERFWSFVDKGDGCWLWMGGLGSQGYGQYTQWRYPTSRAHRIAWTLTNGPIADGAHVLHRCDNPRCVKPAHLFLGTHVDNMRDMVAKGRRRGPQGEQHPAAKLTSEAVMDIRRRRAAGALGIDLAREYGVTPQAISRIWRGKNWKQQAQEALR